MDRLQELVRLHRLGTPARQVARVLRMGVDVERSYRRVLETAGLLRGDVQVRIPAMPITESGPSRTPIPEHAEHRMTTLVGATSPPSSRWSNS
ncbi:hypothetical protein M0222_09575, partial [Myxococcus fulvus]|nr:hypothetical protein [Myxococcus fulvus]